LKAGCLDGAGRGGGWQSAPASSNAKPDVCSAYEANGELYGVGAEGWHAGAWVDESTTANLVEQTEASNDRPSAAHPHRSISTRSIFQRMPPCLAWGVTWPKCKVRLCPWTSWMGSAKALPRGELCAPCESSVCMSVWLAGRPGQSDADRVSVFCTCATLMGPQRRCAGKLASRSQLRRSIFGMDN
jgi:hypothetical protein